MILYVLKHGDAPVIDAVDFEVLSAEDIRAQSVVSVTETSLYSRGLPNTNGLNDLRMGTVERRLHCSTCGENVKLCPGHFGHIELPWPCYHVQFVDTVLKTLRCVCFFCSRVNLSDSDAQGVKMLHGKWKFAHVHNACKARKKCTHCSAPQPTYHRTPTGIRLDWGNASFESEEEEQYCNRPFTSRQAQSILSYIPREDLKVMGFERSHPKDFILDAVVVAPTVARPAVMASEGSRARGQDDMTLKLMDILRRCVEVRQLMPPLPSCIDEHVDLDEEMTERLSRLQLEVFSFMNSNVKAPKRPGKGTATTTVKSVGDRLRGKEGRIRANLMGKRVNHSARSVISPDVIMDVDEVGVPRQMALQLTVPERVSSCNIAALTWRVHLGPNRIDGADSVVTSGGVIISLAYCAKRTSIRLQVGWVVQRYLQDGDPVIFNRQPSLHKMGMMAHRAKIVEQSTFRLHLSVTAAYNADFDGDEMNLHVPQSPASIVECQTIMSVPSQIVSCAANKPCIAIVQDALVGMYLMTRDDVLLTKSEVMRLAGWLRYPHRPWWEPMPPPAISHPQQAWTGRQVASMLFPPRFFYARGGVVVREGVLLSGTLDKQTLGTSSGGIVDVLCRDFGSGVAVRFLSDLQRLVNQFMLSRGFNVGISDCVPSARSHERTASCVDTALENVGAIYDHGIPEAQASSAEVTIKSILSKTLMNAASVVHDEMEYGNAIKCMVTSGSKGNMLNLSQICGVVGQQTVEGKRVCAGVERPLSHFAPGSTDVAARGFVRSSYIQGLDPAEHFFHAMGGREGLVDTSVKTATTGYLQRRLVKGMEDNRAEYDGTVRNAEGGIIEFVYGADGYDPSKLEKFNIPAIDWGEEEMREAIDDGTRVGEEQLRTAMRLRDSIWRHRKAQVSRVETQVLCAMHLKRKLDSLPAEEESAERPEEAVEELLLRFAHSEGTQLMILVHLSSKQVAKRRIGGATLKGL